MVHQKTISLLFEKMGYSVLGIKGQLAENYTPSSRSLDNSHSFALLIGGRLAT